MSRWDELARIFTEALEREGETRERYLRDRCAGDEEMEAEIRSLLSQPASILFLSRPPR